MSGFFSRLFGQKKPDVVAQPQPQPQPQPQIATNFNAGLDKNHDVRNSVSMELAASVFKDLGDLPVVGSVCTYLGKVITLLRALSSSSDKDKDMKLFFDVTLFNVESYFTEMSIFEDYLLQVRELNLLRKGDEFPVPDMNKEYAEIIFNYLSLIRTALFDFLPQDEIDKETKKLMKEDQTLYNRISSKLKKVRKGILSFFASGSMALRVIDLMNKLCQSMLGVFFLMERKMLEIKFKDQNAYDSIVRKALNRVKNKKIGFNVEERSKVFDSKVKPLSIALAYGDTESSIFKDAEYVRNYVREKERNQCLNGDDDNCVQFYRDCEGDAWTHYPCQKDTRYIYQRAMARKLKEKCDKDANDCKDINQYCSDPNVIDLEACPGKAEEVLAEFMTSGTEALPTEKDQNFDNLCKSTMIGEICQQQIKEFENKYGPLTDDQKGNIKKEFDQRNVKINLKKNACTNTNNVKSPQCTEWTNECSAFTPENRDGKLCESNKFGYLSALFRKKGDEGGSKKRRRRTKRHRTKSRRK